VKVKKVAIVTDSAACLPQELIWEHDIRVVPFVLIFGGRVYQDGVDMTTAEFYRMLQESPLAPTTSQPSIGDFLTVYETLRREAEAVVSIHVPATLSGCWNSAMAAARQVPDLPVHVIDCGTAAMAQGFVVLAAARAAMAGASAEEVVRAAERVIQRVRLYATLGTLKYLARSGRVPGVLALASAALHIHPVLSMRKGEVRMVARVRSKRRAVAYMLEQMVTEVKGYPVHVAVFHAAALDEARALRDVIAERFSCVELYVTEFTPVMGAHTGPGVVGVAFYAE